MASSEPDSVDRKVLDDLYEDIHWLILVSGLSQTKKSEIKINFFCDKSFSLHVNIISEISKVFSVPKRLCLIFNYLFTGLWQATS